MNVFRNTCREIEYQIANRKLQIANCKLQIINLLVYLGMTHGLID